ncbi:PREDICTED: pre-mRNA-processing factor 39 isoform X2 [Papilio polytes]|uniref:pre-mRNA-processing factor 39 isoform X2 n=1 Tax=Papilio polytes TaxID=76194 RepID=UPI000675F839|nr:PREDICTED: pre-mRNA-processing factor 39 isoform X2 [Papilio polytes]
MDDDASSDVQKCVSESPMDTDEGPLINENSNGLSHLLTEGEFNSVDTGVVDESSTSNQGFLNAVELSAGSVGDYLENNASRFSADNFDVGDNAVEFSNESSNALTDGDSRLSEPGFKAVTSDIDDSKDEKVEVGSDNADENSADLTKKIIMAYRSKIVEDAKLEETDTDINSKPRKLSNEINEASEDISCDKDKITEGINKNLAEEQKLDLKQDTTDTLKNDKNDIIDAKADEDKTELNAEANVGGAEETEVVSEDELPAVQKPSIKDAENVSDDELPGPKPADLPADTEVVSEDELPSSKKESKESRKRKPDEERDGYDPGSPTSEGESSNKKQAVAKNGESKPIPAEKRSSIDEKPKKKPLPELDKYWKVVNDDPTDFTGWTYLLQYVDQESDVEAAREAYDAFLSHYPYCYGYWRKYADYEKRKGSKKKCLECNEAATLICQSHRFASDSCITVA